MKNLNELYDEIVACEELKKEFVSLDTTEKVASFVATYGCDATLEDINNFFKEKLNAVGELSDEQLDQVSGGVRSLCIPLAYIPVPPFK